MKKLLLTTAACGLVMSASAAHAQVELNLGGSFKGYGVWVNQDEPVGTDVHTVDFIRNTEVHFTGETTLDNGLTVGFHIEAEADGGDGFTVDESYAYFSGAWGRVNFGDEDGATYLLQVAAPSADENIDGIRQFVNPVNYTVLINSIQARTPNANQIATRAVLTAGPVIGIRNSGGIDYDADPTGKNTKLTYLSPIMNGFQVGASYTPDSTSNATENGVRVDNQAGVVEETYEIGARYEGQFDMVGVTVGAGYSHGEIGTSTAATRDRKVWNAGVDLDIGPFGVGVAYKNDNGARDGVTADKEQTWVVGADYTTGPFKLGASYFHQNNTFAINDLDTRRYSGGVTYTYGPGMTFRGSIGHVDHKLAGYSDVDATYVTLGTQINF